MARPMRTVLGLATAAFASPLASVLAVPIVIANVGVDSWSSLAVGLSLGSVAAILVGLGWSITGSVAVARASDCDRLVIARRSRFSRFVVGPPIILLAMVIAAEVTPIHPLASALSAAAVAAVGLDMSWYFIGEGRVGRLLALDTVPKVAGTIVGAGAVIAGAGVGIFAAVQLAGVATAVIVSALVTRGAPASERMPSVVRELIAEIRERRVSIGIAVSAASYLSLPTALIAIFASSVLPLYALSERVWRTFAIATFPVVQWLQHSTRVSATSRDRIIAFRRWAVLAGAMYGVVSGILAPIAVEVLSAGTASIDPLAAALIGVTVGAGTLPRLLGSVLLQHLDRAATILVTTAAGAVVGIVGIPLGAATGGLRGAVAAIALAELVVGIGQYWAISRVVRRSAQP